MGSLALHHGFLTVSGSRVAFIDTSRSVSHYVYLIGKHGGALFYTLDTESMESIAAGLKFYTLTPPARDKDDAKARTLKFKEVGGPHSNVFLQIKSSGRWVPVTTRHRLEFVH